MRSMTGFGSHAVSSRQREISVDVRSVNNRYLDISVALPSFLMSLEAELKRTVSARAQRGKVEVMVRLREYETDTIVHVDRAAARAARAALDEIAAEAGIDRQPRLSDILAFDGIMQTERNRDPEAYREEIMNALERALDQWDAARRREGALTAADLRTQLERVRAAAGVFADAAPETERRILEAVQGRFRDVLGDDADEQRIYAEVALLLVKHATNEEEVRLRGHIDSFVELMDSDDPIGKRMDFICQEMNREINTTGSKTILQHVQHAVVDAKDAVEAIREQIRNIE